MSHIPWQSLSLGFLQTAYGIVLDLKDIEKNISIISQRQFLLNLILYIPHFYF